MAFVVFLLNKPAKGDGRTMLSEIVIEAEAPRSSQIVWRLRIDTHVIAENLTAAQAQFLVGEILDRFAVAEVGNMLGSIERRSSD